MISNISAQAHAQVQPKLSQRRQEIVNILLSSGGPMTSNQLSQRLRELHPHISSSSNDNTRVRVLELVDLGLVVVDHVGRDPLTGMSVRWYRMRRPGEPQSYPVQPGRARRQQAHESALRQLASVLLEANDALASGDDDTLRKHFYRAVELAKKAQTPGRE